MLVASPPPRLCAFWPEIIFVSPHPLSEAISAWFFLWGAALFFTSRRDFASGLLLGLAFVARIQVAPAVAALVIIGGWRRIPSLFSGGMVALVIDSAINIATGHAPLVWIYNDVAANLIDGKAASFGVSPVNSYLLTFAADWNGLLVVIVPLAIWGGIKHPALFSAALVHLVVHSLIGHKEWRFVFLVQVVLIMLAGLGIGRLVRTKLASITAALIGVVTIAVAMSNPRWVRSYWDLRPLGTAMRLSDQIAPSCAVALYKVLGFGGAHSLQKNERPFLYFDAPGPLIAVKGSIGSVITAPQYAPKFRRDFPSRSCVLKGAHSFCVLKKSGTCRDRPPKEHD